MTRYPTPGFKLTTRRQRVEATGFETEVDARAAIMEHTVSNPDDDYSLRVYTGEGVYVLVIGAESRCWLTYAAA